MKKTFRYLALAVMATAAAVFTACNADSEWAQPLDSATPETRGDVQPNGSVVITFEDAGDYLAGPTSYGDNLYSAYEGGEQYTMWMDVDAYAIFSINENYGTTEFWNGGIAVSDWCIRRNVDGNTKDWWYSYLNQCSVYNVSVGADARRGGAGYGGSDNFAVVYGYVDEYNAAYMSYPEISFEAPGTVSDLWICNTAYTYGVIMNGNHWDDGEDDGWTGTARPLKEVVDEQGRKGYLRVDAYGFYGDEPTNGGEPVSIYLADYNASAAGNVLDT